MIKHLTKSQIIMIVMKKYAFYRRLGLLETRDIKWPERREKRVNEVLAR